MIKRQAMEASKVKGYLSPEYANSLSEFGDPIYLENCKGWILKRRIPGTEYFDAMGLYPIFACDRWNMLERDIATLSQTVSISLVTDPFGDFEPNNLKSIFKSKLELFKHHYIADLKRGTSNLISSHHIRNIILSKKSGIKVNIHKKPICILESWITLYDHLINKHKITGISAFSYRSFEKQLQVPGCVAFSAEYEDKLISILIYFEKDNVAYYHLGSSNDIGYEKRASFLLHEAAISHYKERQGIRFLSFGGGAGTSGDEKDGLSRFKRGWSSGKKRVYFCGQVLDDEVYNSLSLEKVKHDTNYFPAYRYGEFT